MSCLNQDDLTAFVEGRVEGDARETMIEHLATCADCRRALVAAGDLAPSTLERVEVSPSLLETARRLGRRPAPRRAPWVWPAAAALLTAVGLGVATLGPWQESPPVSVGDGLRSTAEGGGPFEALAPSPAALLGQEPLELRWNELPNARSYTVTVLDALGNILLRESTTENHWTLDPQALQVGSAEDLYWYVRADLEDFTVRETDPRELRRSPGTRDASTDL